jgi:hypothetical protein
MPRITGPCIIAITIAALASAGAQLLPAQQAPSQSAAPVPTYYPPFYSESASTLAEGSARGLADIVRSAGAANLMHSEAAKNYEDARAKAFDNRLKMTQTYFDLKQQNQDLRSSLRGQRTTAEQLFRLAKERAPDPLDSSELDPYSGEIHWPALLLSANYAELRVAVDDLVRKRIADPVGMTVEERAALRAALDSIAAQMRANIAAYDPKEYTGAKNFLQGLAATTGVGAL